MKDYSTSLTDRVSWMEYRLEKNLPGSFHGGYSSFRPLFSGRHFYHHFRDALRMASVTPTMTILPVSS